MGNSSAGFVERTGSRMLLDVFYKQKFLCLKISELSKLTVACVSSGRCVPDETLCAGQFARNTVHGTREAVEIAGCFKK